MSKVNRALLKVYKEAHGHVPAVEPWMLLNEEPDALSVMEAREQIVLRSDYVETPRYFLFFVTPTCVICYNKNGGAKPTGKCNTEHLVRCVSDTASQRLCADIDLQLIDTLIGDCSVSRLDIEIIVSRYCDLKGYFIYTNGTRGLWYQSGRVYAKDASYTSENKDKLKAYFRSMSLTTLRKALDVVLANHAGEIEYHVFENKYEQLRGPIKRRYKPIVHKTPIVRLDPTIDIFADGFFVYVNLIDAKYEDLLNWLRSTGKKEVLSYVEREFRPSFLDKIGSLDFYQPAGMTLLRAKQVQVEYRVKGAA